MNSLSLLARRAAILAARRSGMLRHHLSRPIIYRTLTTTTNKHPFAVDAPDGTSEALLDAEQHQVDDIIEHAASHQDTQFVKEMHQEQADAAQTFAVDAPDGESDAMHHVDEEAIEQVINYAAAHEDKEKVIKMHKLDQAVRESMAKRSGVPYFVIPSSITSSSSNKPPSSVP